MKTVRPLRRLVLGTAATVSGVVLLLALKPHTATQAVIAQSPSSAPSVSSTPSPSSPGSGSSSSSSSSSSKRTVTGDTAQTRWGPVQVEITVESGKLTAVEVLQSPSDNPRDQEISSFALPQLTQEALAAQNASIDTVSGATYTSEGYIQSLQSALDRAGL